jgi:hypothetical protein
MPKQKNNWGKLKLDFLLSEHPTVTGFFHDKNLPYNSHTRAKTKGWVKEKKAYLKEANEQIKQMVIEEKGEMMKGSINMILTILNQRIMTNPHELDHKTLKSTWEIFRTELGMPTRIHDRGVTSSEQDGITNRMKLDEMHIRIMKRYKAKELKSKSHG